MIKLTKKILLASNSPRRKELLGGLGLSFEVRATDVDENSEGITPALVSAFLAEKKALAFQEIGEDELVLAADTVVVLNNSVLGKPLDRQEAIAMLTQQSGRTQQVYTSVCLRSREGYTTETDIAEVVFRELSESEIAYYVDNFRPFDKAGAYGIQEWIGMVGVERINGSFYTIMGLPTHRLYEMLKPWIVQI